MSNPGAHYGLNPVSCIRILSPKLFTRLKLKSLFGHDNCTF